MEEDEIQSTHTTDSSEDTITNDISAVVMSIPTEDIERILSNADIFELAGVRDILPRGHAVHTLSQTDDVRVAWAMFFALNENDPLWDTTCAPNLSLAEVRERFASVARFDFVRNAFASVCVLQAFLRTVLPEASFFGAFEEELARAYTHGVPDRLERNTHAIQCVLSDTSIDTTRDRLHDITFGCETIYTALRSMCEDVMSLITLRIDHIYIFQRTEYRRSDVSLQVFYARIVDVDGDICEWPVMVYHSMSRALRVIALDREDMLEKEEIILASRLEYAHTQLVRTVCGHANMSDCTVDMSFVPVHDSCTDECGVCMDAHTPLVRATCCTQVMCVDCVIQTCVCSYAELRTSIACPFCRANVLCVYNE